MDPMLLTPQNPVKVLPTDHETIILQLNGKSQNAQLNGASSPYTNSPSAPPPVASAHQGNFTSLSAIGSTPGYQSQQPFQSQPQNQSQLPPQQSYQSQPQNQSQLPPQQSYPHPPSQAPQSQTHSLPPGYSQGPVGTHPPTSQTHSLPPGYSQGHPPPTNPSSLPPGYNNNNQPPANYVPPPSNMQGPTLAKPNQPQPYPPANNGNANRGYGAPYPPPAGGAYPQQGGYPPAGGAYPQQGGYPPQQGGYAPMGGYPPPAGISYPPPSMPPMSSMPPMGAGYPPAMGMPPMGGYPPAMMPGGSLGYPPAPYPAGVGYAPASFTPFVRPAYQYPAVYMPGATFVLPIGLPPHLAAKMMQASAAFRMFDTNYSGSLSKKEWKRALRYLGYHLPKGYYKWLFYSVDTNRSGGISEREFCEWWILSGH